MVWDIKTTHRRNLLGTVITLSLTLGVFSGSLLEYFIGIAILTRLVRLSHKVTLARVPAIC
jgi:hypothetical protein